MRLARHGRKRFAYYHIVIADSRSPRDGRYIETIGTYNPNSNPDKNISFLFLKSVSKRAKINEKEARERPI